MTIYKYKGKDNTLTSTSDFLNKYTLKDGDTIVFEVQSILPLLTKDIESTIDAYIKNQRKSKLDKLK